MFTHFTSMSSKEVALSEAAQRKGKDIKITRREGIQLF